MSDEEIGPALPPHLAELRQRKAQAKRVAGPSLQDLFAEEKEKVENDDSDDDIGPMPLAPGQTVDSVKTAQQIEIEKQREREAWERVREKETLDNAGKAGREEWMTALPDKNNPFSSLLENQQKGSTSGVGARKGLGMRGKRAVEKDYHENEDKSIWTDTPADRQRKRIEMEAKEARRQAGRSHDPAEVPRKRKARDISDVQGYNDNPKLNPRDARMKEMADAYNASHRATSLVDQHTTKMSEETAKRGTKRVHQEWDRDRDLLQRKTDPSKALADAQQLHGRFAQSSSRKYL